MTPRYYTGIGSRETPEAILAAMENLAIRLYDLGLILRSGGAQGADTAFSKGSRGREVIYLPWRGFNGVICQSSVVPPFTHEVMGIAERFHPAWSRCSPAARKMHARNVYQVLGNDLRTHSAFVVCWTPEGKGGGGTGQAIRIARAHAIPVFDMGHGPVTLDEILVHLQEKK